MALLSERIWAAVRDPKATPPWALSALATVAVAIAYFLSARLSLVLLEKPDGVAAFWPAAGVASGALIIAGSAARWPVILGVMAATIVANLLGDRNVWSSIVFAAANAGEAAIVAALIARWYGPLFELNTLRRVIGLFAATIAGAVVSGIAGTIGFVWFHGAALASVPTVWFHWVVSDGLGTLTVAPLVIGLASLIRNVPSTREAIESALALAVVCVVCAFLVFLPNRPWTLELATIALCPFFVWIAARLPPGIASAATFICATTIVATTTFSIGIFGDSGWLFDQRIESAQASILAISFGALVLTALFSERRLQAIALLDREVRLEEALRAGGVMAFEWDLDADLVRHSQNAVPILGFGSKGAISGAEMLGRVHPDERPHVTACMRGVNPDKPSYSVTFRYQRADCDSEVWLEQVATAEFDSDGLPMRIRGLTTDITQRKRFEAEISHARKLAERADRTKSIFLAAASHDLRQPLQTLRLLHGALEQQHPDGEGQKMIAGIGHSIDTMSSMLSSLLDINRLETGSLRPSKSDFAVNEIFNSAATDLLQPLGEKGLQWRVVPSDLVVHSDKRMLEEMIRNLLSNAIRYTDRGKILMGCRRAGGKIRIEVWDTGIGIPGDQLPHIFEEYYCDPERGGFGLGLAIVRRLGEILDHRIDVRSTPGRGTGFSIEVARGRENVGGSASVPASDFDGELFRGTVLVIEDETSVRAALNRLLTLRGVDVIGVATVSDAVTLIKQKDFSPDLVVCDYNLPGPMNGVESIELLRTALAWNLPAIVMTGDTRSTTMEAIASYGVPVLVKPFLGDELIRLFNRLCRSSESPDRDRSARVVARMDERVLR
jgi:signal transduction histidine kinase/integral membrane sensor domain MASE1/CheY-like chemotaxis protein